MCMYEGEKSKEGHCLAITFESYFVTDSESFLMTLTWGIFSENEMKTISFPIFPHLGNPVRESNLFPMQYSPIYYISSYVSFFPAIKEDGCNVKAYTAWSLLDNFEWASGYTEKFGLHYVNFSDPDRPRTVKDSARYVKQIISDNGFVDYSSTSSPTGSPNYIMFILVSLLMYSMQ